MPKLTGRPPRFCKDACRQAGFRRVTKLQRCSRAEGVLREHGLDGDRLHALVYRCLQSNLNRRGAYLAEERFQDCLDYLVLAAITTASKYDPTRSRPGTYKFESYLWDILEKRVIDWWRVNIGDMRFPELLERKAAFRSPLPLDPMDENARNGDRVGRRERRSRRPRHSPAAWSCPVTSKPESCMLGALGGHGKTTWFIDVGLHLAAGIDYPPFTVPRPVSILMIENEGPEESDDADREVATYRREATHLRRKAVRYRHRYARRMVVVRQRQSQVVGARRTSPRAPRSRRHVRRARARSPAREPDEPAPPLGGYQSRALR